MITKPKFLDEEASRFWTRHAPALKKAGLLTERDVESFALLCRLWSVIQQVDINEKVGVMKLLGCTKQYLCLARQFGMLPMNRKKDNLETQEATPDEWGI